MPVFTTDWFSRHIPLWEQLLARYRGRPGLRFLEVGSFEGRSTVWLLENILTHQTARLICMDTFASSPEHEQLGIDTSGIYARFRRNTAPYARKMKSYGEGRRRSCATGAFGPAAWTWSTSTARTRPGIPWRMPSSASA